MYLSSPSRSRLYLPQGFRCPQPRGMGGLGQANISQIVSTGAAATGSLIAAFTLTGAAAGPLGAAIGAAAGLIAQVLVQVFKGCGNTCVEATSIANQVEPVLQQNLAAYMAEPVHYQSLQAAYLNNFDTAWAALVQNCSNPALQSAGQNCITDRQRGSCAYKTSSGGWNGKTYTPPGANGSGSACWNWFVGYRDPIANDPNVVPDPSASGSSVLSSVGINPSTTIAGIPLSSLLLPAGLLIAAVLILGTD